MRIAILSETFLPKVDGIANTLGHLMEYLGDKGHASILFAPKGGPTHYAQTPIVNLPAFPAPGYPELSIIYPWSDVTRHLIQFKPDIVHLVSPFGYTVGGMLAAKRLGIPTIASYHTDVPGFAARAGLGIFSGFLWNYFRWLHNQADLNLVPSNFTRQQIKARGFKRVGIWSRGVDTTLYHPERRSQEWRLRLTGGHPDQLLLLYAGRLAREKRIEMLLPIMRKHTGIRLAIVGDGPERKNLESFFSGTATLFTGYLHGTDLAQAYASADLFVFTGANETFGNVVTEAMASGLPVVAPNSGGVVEHVQAGRTGFLFESESEEALQATVARLIEEPARLVEMSFLAREAAKHYSWDHVMHQLVDQYNAVQSARSRFRLNHPARRVYQPLSER
jgi:glycosyltransferase involved in cell wall biosynthesis